MRTHGHRKGNITYRGLSGGGGGSGGMAGVGVIGEGITLGEILNIDDRGMDAANHHGMYITI